MHTKFWSLNLEERDNLKDLGHVEDNTRMDLWETESECVDWMHLAQYRGQRRVL
jgi:hypothetical protein